MNTLLSPNALVGKLVAEQPARAQVFEQYGIDYCCGGKTSLLNACSTKQVDIHTVLVALQECEHTTPPPNKNWNTATLTSLCDHIEEVHHAYLQIALPRISALIRKVVQAHGDKHPHLARVQTVFEAMRSELEQHMVKEEQILFPLCRNLEATENPFSFNQMRVHNPVGVMIAEHEEAGAALKEMRTLTNDYTPPSNACNTFRAMLHALEECERDLHQHIHLENNILFPRAEAKEQQIIERG